MGGFHEALARGQHGEEIVADWYRAKGALVVPVCDVRGIGKRPPITPDLLVIDDGQVRWVEVKLKAAASHTRVTDRAETGISMKHWQRYMNCQEVTQIPVDLVFIHLEEDEVLFRSLDGLKSLPPRVYYGSKMSWGGMVYFPTAAFKKIGTVGEFENIASGAFFC